MNVKYWYGNWGWSSKKTILINTGIEDNSINDTYMQRYSDVTAAVLSLSTNFARVYFTTYSLVTHTNTKTLTEVGKIIFENWLWKSRDPYD